MRGEPSDTRTGALEPPASRVSRRGFLAGVGALAATGTLASCETGDGTAVTPVDPPAIRPADAAPGAPGAARNGGALRFLNPEQASQVDAVIARLIPGDADDPGAREAGVIYYIDNVLASHEGYAEPTYRRGPFPMTYEGEPPDDADDDVVWVPADERDRYGWQSALGPGDMYRTGLVRLDRLARQRFGRGFTDLGANDQDELLMAVEDGEDDDVAAVFDGDPRAGEFFELVRRHTVQGFLADPVYGGNHGMAGWRLVGFPGSQRGYSPEQMHDEDVDIPPQSLLDLPPFNAHNHHDPADGALGTVRRPHPNGPAE